MDLQVQVRVPEKFQSSIILTADMALPFIVERGYIIIIMNLNQDFPSHSGVCVCARACGSLPVYLCGVVVCMTNICACGVMCMLILGVGVYSLHVCVSHNVRVCAIY